MRLLNLRYHKRFQMEVDLRRWRRTPVGVYPEYRLASWSPDLLHEHAEVKYLSFRDELDAVVFPCLGEMQSCLRLMEEIVDRDGFVPEATWLAQYVGAGPHRIESCGTIQAIRTTRQRANIQNIGVTPHHRGRGVGKRLMAAVTSHPELQNLRLWTLFTRDAHGLYRQVGFEPPRYPDRLMERRQTQPYPAGSSNGAHGATGDHTT